MTDPQAFHDSDMDNFADSEAWIRAAGDYLEVSEDLRPATLEAARTVVCEKRVGGGMLVAAVLGLLLTLPTTAEHPLLRNSQAGQLAPENSQLAFANSQELFRFVGTWNSRPGAETGASVESGWSWVEAFQQVHRQRSAALGRR